MKASIINRYKTTDKEFNKLFIMVFLVTIFFACYPLMNNKFIVGDDFNYHLWRIENIKMGLLSGQFPVKIGPIFLNGHGYASSLFYPDLFLYIPAIFRIMGLSMEVSYKLFIILCIGATYITTYITVKYITKNTTSALCSTILFVLSQYFLLNIYCRVALGEIQAYIFIPLVVFGIYDLVFKDFDKNYVMGIGFIGLMFTHTISLVIMLLITAIIVLFNFKKVILNKKKLTKLILTALVVLLITSCFWICLIEQMLSGKFKYQTPWTTISERGIWPGELISFSGKSIGVNIVALALLRIFISEKNIKVLDWFLGIGIVIALVTTNFFPWKLFNNTILNSIQFPWRFITQSTLFLCIAIGMIMFIVAQKVGHKKVVASVLIISCSYAASFYNLQGIGKRSIDIPKEYFEVDKDLLQIGGGAEWLPVEVENVKDLISNKSLTSNLGDSIEYIENGIDLEFGYEKNKDYKYFDIPRIYYKGYRATLLDENNNKSIDLNIEKSKESGLIRVYVPKDKSGVIKIEYKGTIIQNISMFISVISVIGVAYVYFGRKKYKKSDSKKESLNS